MRQAENPGSPEQEAHAMTEPSIDTEPGTHLNLEPGSDREVHGLPADAARGSRAP